MPLTLPASTDEALDWGWEQFQPYADELLSATLDADSLNDFMTRLTALDDFGSEVSSRIYIDTTLNTIDEQAKARFMRFIQELYPQFMRFNDAMNRKIVESGLTPPDYEVPLRSIKSQIALFREANLPLLTQEQEWVKEYEEINGAQTVIWDGEEKTLTQVATVLHETDRARREAAFRAIMERRLQDRAAIDGLWAKLYPLRQQIARNADYPDYRAYMWQARERFDYTPQDVERFHEAIRQVVVPAVSRLNEKRRAALGLDALRQWDVQVDVKGREPLKPFRTGAELQETSARIFDSLDPELGRMFRLMKDEGLLDLENRKHKAPGGYQSTLPYRKRPFIFMNAVGLHDDVQTMLHEAGHAFHMLESAQQPYSGMRGAPIEFCEVASMSMELLAAPYLEADKGGFYSPAEAARARLEHLEGMLVFWPYMAVVDAFQSWAYTHPEGADPRACDAKWAELWHTYKQGVDYSGLEDWVMTGWQRKLHIMEIPFYYIEYGLAQLGAAQVWANSLHDPQQALSAYRQALALGNTRTLPQLFEAAGAKLAFDVDTLGRIVALIEKTIDELEALS
jgi:oligoendopeptidase F